MTGTGWAWEYTAIYVRFTRLNPAGRIEHELNQYGADGWDFFETLNDGNYLIFLGKRPYQTIVSGG